MKPLEGLRILVLEDDFYLATDTCEWLQDSGADVVGPAPTASKAMQLLDEQEIDGAVLDINLGFGPDYDVARRLAGEGTPILFATGYDQSVLLPEFDRAERLEKPFTGAQLVRKVEEMTVAGRPDLG